MSEKQKVLNLPDLIGKGYGDFFRFKGRFCVCKGSRASKKSKTTALWHIYNLMKYPAANALVIRKTERTLKDSVFSDLRWAIDRLGVTEHWKHTTNPLELTYIPTGQRIVFRGLDDPLKITSISVPKGVLCFVWLEEAYEISREEDFDFLNESIRGEVPEGLFKRFTITFNPWTDKHWLKKRFFDTPDNEDKMAFTTNYLCNEWLDEADRRMFEDMKVNRPKRYRVAGLGEWGIVDGLIYENWVEQQFDVQELIKNNPDLTAVFGLDFGYTNDPTSFICALVDGKKKRIYVFDEFYQKAMTNEMIAEKVIGMGFSKEKIIADSAEPKSIDRLYELGLRHIRKARKGRDSLLNGISYMQEFNMVIHPKCVNFITEISNYVWDEDNFGQKVNKPIDDFNHGLDALRYAMMNYNRGSLVSFD